MARRANLIAIGSIVRLCILSLIATQQQDRPTIAFNKTVAINDILKAQPQRILKEMENFELPSERFGTDPKNLTDLIIETNGNPVRSILISTWRSGSTFLGDIINSIPGNYYHYEPLFYTDKIIRGPPDDQKAIYNLIDLLKCDYTNMSYYLEVGKGSNFALPNNKRLWLQCKQFCWDLKFLASFCRLFPLQSMKILHLRLPLAEKILADKSLNVRVLYLVRDPRGTMKSRKHIRWCTGNSDCDNATNLCRGLELDHVAAKYLLKKYPSRFRAVRYEDLSLNLYEMTQKILRFYGLPFHPLVKSFLDTHTKLNRGNVYSTFRDSKSIPFKWIEKLSWLEIQKIELSCKTAMTLWGYRQVNNVDNLVPSFDPLILPKFGPLIAIFHSLILPFNTLIPTAVINDTLNAQRQRIHQEMKNFEYPSGRFGNDAEKLTALTMETNGSPVRSIIITTWRSGSKFLGDIINSMPGNYYHYEALLNFDIKQIRGPPDDQKAIYNLINLLKCDYSNMTNYLEYDKQYNHLFLHNKRLWLQCKKFPKFCDNVEFLASFCKLFPLQSMKILRLRLALAEKLLADESLNVRMLYLVRDPRGTMQSRKQTEWCTGNPDCDNAPYLCMDLVLDYAAAKYLIKKYPSRFRTLRYEDLTLNPYEMTQEILQFYGLPFDPVVEEFLDTHTKLNLGGVTSTFRDSKSTPFRWIKNFTWLEIQNIELSCKKAMTLWGYRQIKNKDNLIPTFDPLITPPPFT